MHFIYCHGCYLSFVKKSLHALGPQQQWTDKSKAVSLMLDEICIYNREQLTNEVGGTLWKGNHEKEGLYNI